MSNPTKLALCCFLALAQGAMFVGAQRSLSETLSFPLDDSFIHLQYGKQIARGYYFQYQDGAPATGGATSFLYPHLLALGWLIGFQHDWLIGWALLIAWTGVSYVLYLLVRCGERLGSSLAGWSTMLLVFASGHLGWAFWGGMEIALFTALFLWLMYELLRETVGPMRLGLAMGLLSLTRPEGVFIVVGVVGLLILRSLTAYNCKLVFQQPLQRLASSVFVTACLFGPPVFYRIAMGRWGGNSLMAKSLLYHPIKSLSERISESASNAVDVFKFYSGAPSIISHPGEFMFPGALLLALCGFLIYMVSPHSSKRWQAAFAGAPFVIVFAAVATLEVWQLHNFRYLAPMIPWVFLWSVIGAESCVRRLLACYKPFVRSLAALLILLALSYLPSWASRYAHESAVIAEKQRQAAEWSAKNLSGYLAINDAGALAYYGGLPIYDLVGLVSNDTTLAYRIGEGALYERMQRLPQTKRPQFAAVFPTWFEESSRRFDLFYNPRVQFPDPFDPNFGKTVYEINWFYDGNETAPRERTLRDQWRVIDSIDIADMIDEREHDYQLKLRDGRFTEVANPFRRNFGYHEEIDETWPEIENEVDNLIPMLWADGRIYQYDILDAGRRVNGAESFTLSGLEPRKEAYLILRTCDNEGDRESFDFRMAVEVDGVYLGDWTVEGTPWNWYEIVFTIPAQSVKTDTVRVRIRNIGTSRFPYYDSYMYWICQ